MIRSKNFGWVLLSGIIFLFSTPVLRAEENWQIKQLQINPNMPESDNLLSPFRGLDISGNGRFIVFSSRGRMVPEDTDNYQDIYMYDRDADGNGIFDEEGRRKIAITRISNGGSHNQNPSISANGRRIVFTSSRVADDVLRGPWTLDSDEEPRMSLYDRNNNTTIRINNPADHFLGGYPQISANGQFVAFFAARIARDGERHFRDCFLFDYNSRQTIQLNLVDPTRTYGLASISPDGRMIGCRHFPFSRDEAEAPHGGYRFDEEILLFNRGNNTSREVVQSSYDGRPLDYIENWNPNVSQNERFLIFFTDSGHKIFVRNQVTGEEAFVARPDGDVMGGDGVISDDGRHIAFVSGGRLNPSDELLNESILVAKNPLVSALPSSGRDTDDNRSCIDSDGGDQPAQKGKMTYMEKTASVFFLRENTAQKVSVDECLDKNTLKEYFCDTRTGEPREKIYRCFCKDGACSMVPTLPLR